MALVTITDTTDLTKLNLTGYDNIDINAHSGTFYGDFQGVAPGTVTGGNDSLKSDVRASANVTISGDALNALLGPADVFKGGNDTIVSGAGIVNLIGDADTSVGKTIGGSDFITRTGSDVNTTVGNESRITGDFTYVVSGDVTGGNDTLTGATAGGGEIISGDVFNMQGGTLHGGSDLIHGGAGADSIFGDAYLAGTSVDNPTIYGGNDSIYGGNGGSVLVGDVGFPNPAIIHGGDDLIYGGTGNDTLMGDQQNNRGGGAPDVRIIGGNDTLYGGAGNDLFVGGGGDDYMNGGTGSDSIGYNQLTYDANGNPTTGGIVLTLAEGTAEGHATGSHGNDTLISIENVLGSLGSDSITGNGDGNLLNGSYGNDTLRGGAGNDTIIGEDGNDTLHGGTGSDWLDPSIGSNLVLGGDGNDTIIAMGSEASSHDTLYGGTGNDRIYTGSRGEHTIYAGMGNDWIFTSGGTSDVYTGTGADVVVMAPAYKVATTSVVDVYDFTLGEDRVNLRQIGATSANVDGLVHIKQTSDGAEITATVGGKDETLILHGVSAASLHLHDASEFILL